MRLNKWIYDAWRNLISPSVDQTRIKAAIALFVLTLPYTTPFGLLIWWAK